MAAEGNRAAVKSTTVGKSIFAWLPLRSQRKEPVTISPPLPPFEEPSARGMKRAILIGLLLFGCAIYGIIFSFLSGALLLPLLSPLAILGLIVIWALPEAGAGLTGIVAALFLAFFVTYIVWPNYLAISLPGLPWITLSRLIGLPMVLCLVVNLSVSQQFRSTLGRTLRNSIGVPIAILTLLILQAASIGYSVSPISSVNALFNFAISWYCTFLVSAYALSRTSNDRLLPELFCVTAILLCLLGLWEYHLQQLPWVGHIPSFLSINDPVVADILAGNSRGQGRGHRVQGPFSTALGLSEFLAIAVPFLFFVAVSPGKLWKRLVAACAIPVLVLVTVLTQSRTGLLGILIACLLYPLGIIWIIQKRHKHSLFASGVLMMSPFLPVVGLAIALIIPGIRIRLLGGGVERYSTQGRFDQWHMGIPKIISHPWGYGVGQAAQVLGYRNAAGMLTIDSYPLRLILDCGVQGLVAYYAIPAVSLFYIFNRLRLARGDDHQLELHLAIGVAVIAFAAMQINFAQQDNEPVMFSVYGMLVALSNVLPHKVLAPNVSRPPTQSGAAQPA